MESNKLLIGAQFRDPQNDIEIELFVLRDLTLKQLLDGIKYGLAKKINELPDSEDKKRYICCKNICYACIDAMETKKNYNAICITSYNTTHFDSSLQGIDINRVTFSEASKTKKLYELGFLSSTRIVFDCNCDYKSYAFNISEIGEAFNPTQKMPEPEKKFPEYNISTRQIYKFDDEPIKIIAPSEPPQKPKQNIFMALLPTVLMVAVMAGVRGVFFGSPSGMSMIIMSVSMGMVTLLTTLLSFWMEKRNYKKSLIQWRKSYEEYIAIVISEIQEREKKDTAQLDEIYPDVDLLLERVPCIHESIFSRASTDDDFLKVRLGVSNNVKRLFEIQGDDKDSVFSSAKFEFAQDIYHNDTVRLILIEEDEMGNTGNPQSYLSHLPYAIEKKYRYLSNAPLLLSLKDVGSLGIVYGACEDGMKSMMERMIFELCYYHSPEELQFVMLFKPQTNWDQIENVIKKYKFLPHFRGLFSDKSQFVFDNESAGSVYSSMLNIMAERNSNNGVNKIPHIIFVVYEEYGLKEHAFAEYLPQLPSEGKPYEDKLGLSFIFVKAYKEHLPRYCSYIIKIDRNGQDYSGVITKQTEYNKQKVFTFHNWSGGNGQYMLTYNAYKYLSALYYTKISQNGKVPSNVSLFEMFGLKEGDTVDIGRYWGFKGGKRLYDITRTLSVPLGKNDNGITYLDLHEKADGPHMLVAGTTGSGKSETILSYLIGLCLRYRPDEINLMLVDMKGGGFIKRIGDLPHVVGKVTNVDGDENGTGAEYMLRRFLNALSAEVKERELLLNQMGVDNIDDYIRACRDIEAHIEKLRPKKGEKSQEETIDFEREKEIRRLAAERPLPHLILVVDEFTELKCFSNENNDVDFIKEITKIARVGRSLGFHIILVSQNIEGAITDDIRVNSKSRLCLKVATRQASKEMINTDLAAAPTMPGNGRAYLLVGTGSKFEYFQSAYSGVNTFKKVTFSQEQLKDMQISTKIMQADKNGDYTVFYDSDKDNTDVIQLKTQEAKNGNMDTQLNAFNNAIMNYYQQHHTENIPQSRTEIPTPRIVFQPPLPERVILGADGKPFILPKDKVKEKV